MPPKFGYPKGTVPSILKPRKSKINKAKVKAKMR